MKLSSKMDHALKAMLELACVYPSQKSLNVVRIAQQHRLSPKFLLQIVIRLKSAGLLHSKRGVDGGYWLAKDPTEMSLCEIFEAVEPSLEGLEKGKDAAKNSDTDRVVQKVWADAHEAFRGYLKTVSLADVLEKLADKESFIYNI